jgi:hypothetical protein
MDPYDRIALAIVLQAMKDASRESDETLTVWLLTDGLFTLEAFGIPVSVDKWRAFVLAGCPGDYGLRNFHDDKLNQ